MSSGLDDYWDRVIRKEEDGVKDSSSYQVGGTHYQAAIQPWDIIDAWELDFFEGNALKYLLRYKYKGKALEDLDKLAHYVQRMRENYIASL